MRCASAPTVAVLCETASVSNVPEITVEEALALLESESAVFVDVRDIGSWREGHIPGALHLGDHNIRGFVDRADKARTTVVYCFHGYSSLGGAEFLLSEGFEDVSSMHGGFAAWHGSPTEAAPREPVVTSRPAAPPRAPVPAAPPPKPEPPPRESRRRKWLRRIRSLSRPKG
jgi:thiosulfate sulfurtransferase